MTPRQQKALVALIRAPTAREAATEAGIGYSTLRRWLGEDEEFRREYERTLSELVSDAARQAKQSMAPALSTLREIVEDQESPPAARVQAAREILNGALKLAELTDVLSRLDKLEKDMTEADI